VQRRAAETTWRARSGGEFVSRGRPGGLSPGRGNSLPRRVAAHESAGRLARPLPRSGFPRKTRTTGVVADLCTTRLQGVPSPAPASVREPRTQSVMVAMQDLVVPVKIPVHASDPPEERRLPWLLWLCWGARCSERCAYWRGRWRWPQARPGRCCGCSTSVPGWIAAVPIRAAPKPVLYARAVCP
jgi:hypothetical protein